MSASSKTSASLLPTNRQESIPRQAIRDFLRESSTSENAQSPINYKMVTSSADLKRGGTTSRVNNRRRKPEFNIVNSTRTFSRRKAIHMRTDDKEIADKRTFPKSVSKLSMHGNKDKQRKREREPTINNNVDESKAINEFEMIATQDVSLMADAASKVTDSGPMEMADDVPMATTEGVPMVRR